jgi:acetoin utilization deacetylase AcuC-like enzyme
VEGESGILLISAQRYESGQFWPEMPESGFSHQCWCFISLKNYSLFSNLVRNTINVPLDEIGYGDAEYAAFMHFLVLPLIRQWQPGLILVSCGFDPALGQFYFLMNQKNNFLHF